MVHPDKVGIEAKKKEDENFKFVIVVSAEIVAKCTREVYLKRI